MEKKVESFKELLYEIASKSGQLLSQGKQVAARFKELRDSVPEMIRSGLVFYSFLTLSTFILRFGSLEQKLPSREKIRQKFRNVVPEDIADKLTDLMIDQKHGPSTFQIKKMCEGLCHGLPLERKQELLRLLIAFLRTEAGMEIQELEGLTWIAMNLGIGKEAFDELLRGIAPNAEVVNKESFYEILGIDRAASQKEIRRAYLRLASECHPDRFAMKSSDEQLAAHNNFIKISKAFQYLKRR